MKKIQIFLIIFLLLLGFVFLSFSFLFQKEVYFEEVSLTEEKVMIISDLHLESNPRNLNCIGDYLKENDISLLIINGDLFDKMHKEEFKEELLEEARGRLAIKEELPCDIIYILALYSHDPYLEEESKNFRENDKEIDVLRGILKLKAEDELFYIFHGDYVLNSIGLGLASLINKLTSNLFYERFAKMVIGAEKEEWVMLGHSHVPGIDHERKVANSGLWIERIYSPTDTAILIEIEEGLEPEVTLVEVPCE
jgi:predicted phosphodiesterase